MLKHNANMAWNQVHIWGVKGQMDRLTDRLSSSNISVWRSKSSLSSLDICRSLFRSGGGTLSLSLWPSFSQDCSTAFIMSGGNNLASFMKNRSICSREAMESARWQSAKNWSCRSVPSLQAEEICHRRLEYMTLRRVSDWRFTLTQCILDSAWGLFVGLWSCPGCKSDLRADHKRWLASALKQFPTRKRELIWDQVMNILWAGH